MIAALRTIAAPTTTTTTTSGPRRAAMSAIRRGGGGGDYASSSASSSAASLLIARCLLSTTGAAVHDDDHDVAPPKTTTTTPPPPTTTTTTTANKNGAFGKGSFDYLDPMCIDALLSSEEIAIRDAAAAFCRAELQPKILAANRNEVPFDHDDMKKMGGMGLLGPTMPEEYGGAGLGYVSYGLIAAEVERVDSSYRSAMSVQSSLVMHPIHAFGDESMRRRYLPMLASGDMIGCFGLTVSEDFCSFRSLSLDLPSRFRIASRSRSREPFSSSRSSAIFRPQPSLGPMCILTVYKMPCRPPPYL
jgi:hypothetical protein